MSALARAQMRARATVMRGSTEIHAALPCTFYPSRPQYSDQGELYTPVASHEILVPEGSDVRSRDRITAIVDRRNNDLLLETTGHLTVLTVTPYPGEFLQIDAEQAGG